MLTVIALWLPILVSTVLVFVTSSVLHMVLPFHKADYLKLPKEDAVRDALRDAGPAPGFYTVPHVADMKDAQSPEMKRKFDEGPVAFVTVMPNGMPSMGGSLVSWFILTLVIGILCAYVASRALTPGAPYLEVFQIIGPVALAAYALGEPISSIWKGQPWGNTFRAMFDGVIYALVTAGVFGWLWPAT